MSSDEATPLSIVVVLGSARPGNMTLRVLRLVLDELEKDPGVDVEVMDPVALRLSWPGGEGSASEMEWFQATIAKADGLVFATPEYHGSFSSVIKMLIENMGFPSMLAGKPVVLLGVAAGVIGAVKALEHLRSVLSHVGALVLPKTVSVASVHEVMDEEGNCRDAALEKRIRGLATALLTHVRG